MHNLILSFLILFSMNLAHASVSDQATILKTEYRHFEKQVATITPDGKIGDFMNYKKIGSYQLLWDLGETPSDYSIIKIYNEHTDGTDDFFVTYYFSQDIVPGKTVIRRIVGPLLGNTWRNDTIDVLSGDYLGSQGASQPLMNADDVKLMKKLGIQLIQ